MTSTWMDQLKAPEESSRDLLTPYGRSLLLQFFLGPCSSWLEQSDHLLQTDFRGVFDDKHSNSKLLKKVGLSKAEVKKSIHSQVLMGFYFATSHSGHPYCSAFEVITKLLALLNLQTKLYLC